MTAYRRQILRAQAASSITDCGRFWLGYLAILAVCAWAVL